MTNAEILQKYNDVRRKIRETNAILRSGDCDDPLGLCGRVLNEIDRDLDVGDILESLKQKTPGG